MASWQFKTHLFVQFVSLSPKIPPHQSPATAGAPASKPAYGGALQKLAICFQRTRKAGSETGAPKAKRPPSRGATKESSPWREPWVERSEFNQAPDGAKEIYDGGFRLTMLRIENAVAPTPVAVDVSPRHQKRPSSSDPVPKVIVPAAQPELSQPRSGW
jgi:hypothetical protein